MILESIVTTTNEDGSTNISPMGPNVPETGNGLILTFELKPFNTSRTFANLKRTRIGVLHVTDDVELFARAAINRLDQMPDLLPAAKVDCHYLANACRAFEFEVKFIDETGPRMHLNCSTVNVHRLCDFWGFNRAKHAVIEAAILATRLDFLPKEEISESFIRLKTIVDKTGGKNEHLAFQLLNDFVLENSLNNTEARNSSSA